MCLCYWFEITNGDGSIATMELRGKWITNLSQLLVKDLIKTKTPSLTSSNNCQYYIAFCTTNNATNVLFLKHRLWNVKELTY
jgi:hypothetical protein